MPCVGGDPRESSKPQEPYQATTARRKPTGAPPICVQIKRQAITPSSLCRRSTAFSSVSRRGEEGSALSAVLWGDPLESIKPKEPYQAR
jgi:hypothetical protein